MAAPFVIRLLEGDITRVHAAMIVVSHFNAVTPVGAEAAIDRIMGGAISRRAASGAINGRFGSTHYLPAHTSPLAAGSVLIVGLGEPERFLVDRLREVGAAIVEAAAAIGVRDAATVLHAGGSMGTDVTRASALLVGGVLEALSAVPGAGCMRELTIVERKAENLPSIEEGIRMAASSPALHVYVERGKIDAPPIPPPPPVPALADHLRIGITRAGRQLKVTVIGHDAFDCSADADYPAEVATKIPANLTKEVLAEQDPDRRAKALCSIGHQLYETFLGWAPFDLAGRIDNAPGAMVVLRLDQWTVDLPWEILFREEQFLSRTKLLARQLEIGLPGRQNALVEPHEVLRVLVVGNPTGDLPESQTEAEVVAESLRRHAGAEVKALIGDVTYDAVSRELDTVNYDVFHYAGHATFDPLQKGASGLQLNDHLLTADDLSTRRFVPRLVFANACNSAQHSDSMLAELESSRATRSLVSGVLAAGARAFVGSMWKVDDAAAGIFATSFYDAVLEHSSDGAAPPSIGYAVRQARQAVVDDLGEGQHAWAGYALYGSPWRPVL